MINNFNRMDVKVSEQSKANKYFANLLDQRGSKQVEIALYRVYKAS